MELRNERMILLAAGFGTSDPAEYERTYGTLAERIRRRYPEADAEIAVTSGRIAERVLEKTGKRPDDLCSALEKAVRKGAEEIRVLPLHVLEGTEYAKLLAALERAVPAGVRVLTGSPLLSEDHLEQTARCLAGELQGCEEKAVIYIGHGADSSARASCRALEEKIRAMGHADVWITDLKTGPEALLKDLAGRPDRQVLLRPLLMTAGHHWKKDIWGEKEDSWRSCLNRAGYRVSGEAKGLLEKEGILDILLRGPWDR